MVWTLLNFRLLFLISNMNWMCLRAQIEPKKHKHWKILILLVLAGCILISYLQGLYDSIEEQRSLARHEHKQWGWIAFILLLCLSINLSYCLSLDRSSSVYTVTWQKLSRRSLHTIVSQESSLEIWHLDCHLSRKFSFESLCRVRLFQSL